MPYTPAHKHSCRAAGLIRRIRQEQAAIADNEFFLQNIEVQLPKDFDGDEISFRDVLNDKVPHARLKVHGKVTAKAKVALMVADAEGKISEHRQVVRDCTLKLRMGVKV